MDCRSKDCRSMDRRYSSYMDCQSLSFYALLSFYVPVLCVHYLSPLLIIKTSSHGTSPKYSVQHST